MLNIVWPIFIIISFSFAIFSGNLEKLNSSIFESTSDAINLSISLLGTICLWSGIMKIASNTSVIEKLTKILKPVIKLLFPQLKNNNEIQKEVERTKYLEQTQNNILKAYTLGRQSSCEE